MLTISVNTNLHVTQKLTAEMKQNVLLLNGGDTKMTHGAVQVAVRILNLEPYITDSSAPGGGTLLVGGV